jgi:hypothetical protein
MLFTVLMKKKERKPIANDSILTNGKESISITLDPSVASGGELQERLIKDNGINRSVNE